MRYNCNFNVIASKECTNARIAFTFYNKNTIFLSPVNLNITPGRFFLVVTLRFIFIFEAIVPRGWDGLECFFCSRVGGRHDYLFISAPPQVGYVLQRSMYVDVYYYLIFNINTYTQFTVCVYGWNIAGRPWDKLRDCPYFAYQFQVHGKLYDLWKRLLIYTM